MRQNTVPRFSGASLVPFTRPIFTSPLMADSDLTPEQKAELRKQRKAQKKQQKETRVQEAVTVSFQCA